MLSDLALMAAVNPSELPILTVDVDEDLDFEAIIQGIEHGNQGAADIVVCQNAFVMCDLPTVRTDGARLICCDQAADLQCVNW